MGKKEKNQEKLLRMLRCHGSLLVNDVVAALALSEASVRRYFAELEKSGQVMRFHGGIRLANVQNSTEYQYNDAASSKTVEKHLIGIAAAEYVVEHDRLFFDSGSTVFECGVALVDKLAQHEIRNLRIVTNSLAFGTNLVHYCPVTATGGTIRSNRMDLCGNVALENISRYNFTKAFLGTDGIGANGELSTTDEETSAMAELVIKRSDEVFILSDGSKIGRTSFVPYGNLADKKITLITDSSADAEILSEFRKRNIKTVTVLKK